MLHAIRQKVIVRSGGRIEICAPELSEGTQAEVIVIEDPMPISQRNLAELIGTGRGAFESPEAADTYLRGERDKWG